LAKNSIVKSRVKHLDITTHFIRDKIKLGLVELEYIKTDHQLADGFTKALTIQKFKQQLTAIGMSCELGGRLEVKTK
jgi:hypothetical protein